MDAELISNLLTRDRWIGQHGFSHGKSFSRYPFTGEFYRAHRWMREKYDRRRHADEVAIPPLSRHSQASASDPLRTS
ncbi:hypothetical protein ABMY26_11525 [Azospirillum sp. HJ39]|uniref:hypothetical protein n=1 Tax=Azospirillum sp. HJ39 TaxID=3159496 RepID=UPI0035563BAA